MNHLSKRLLSLLLLLCLAFGLLSGCTGDNQTDTNTTSSDVVLDVHDILPEDTPLKYTLTEQDLTDLTDLITSVRKKMASQTTYNQAEEELTRLEEKYNYIVQQARIAEILYYCNQNDTTAENNYLDATEAVNSSYLKLVDMDEDLYYLSSYYRSKHLFDISEDELKELLAFRRLEGNLNILQANITAEFYGNEKYDDKTKIDSLYNRYIKTAKEVAQAAYFESYYDYASEYLYARDYGKEQRETFRQYVNQYIIPLYKEAHDAFSKSMEELDYTQQLQITQLIETMAYDEIDGNYLMGYIESLSKTGNMQECMMHMFENQNYICANWDDSHDGAFTITLNEPFCYFGPGIYQSTFTVAHELGHYYSNIHTEDAKRLSFDIAEAHSQGNEMVLLKYLETRLEPEVYNALVNYKIYEFTYGIFLATLIDHFEETVYATEGSETFTTAQYDELMKDVASNYDLTDNEIESLQESWKEVCVTTPVYYLSYATSAVVALNLFDIANKNYALGKEYYKRIVEEIDKESNFVGTLEKAGIPSPFEEEAYISLKNLLKK